MKRTGFYLFALSILFLGTAFSGNAQTDQRLHSVSYTDHEPQNSGRDAMDPHFIRGADVLYAKRQYRVIDTREKQNLIMNWPKNPFNCMVYNSVLEGINGKEIPAYANDSFASTLTDEEVLKKGSNEVLVPIYNAVGEWVKDTIVHDGYRCSDINRFLVMEEIVFDKQRSIQVHRIVGIAPLYKPEVEGVEMREQPMFWVRYDDIREELVEESIFNRHNDGRMFSYADFLDQRLFSSYIVKENNEFDLAIDQFPEYKADAMGALLESRRIERENFNREHDLWEY